jgi:tetratricopeptide (TPR) repeat protein
MRRPVLAALLFAALAVSPQVRAQTADDCYQATLKDDDLAIIRVCGAALDKGGLNTEDRSIVLSNRGLGYLRNKEFDKSIIDFSDALLINPKNAYSFNFRGDAWLQKSNYDRALADFDEALRIDSGFTGALYNRGLTYERQGNVVAARAEYRKAIATRGDRALDKWARDRSQERLTALGDNQPPPQKNQPRSDDRTSERDAGPRDATPRNNDTSPRSNERNTTDPRGNEGVYRRNR